MKKTPRVSAPIDAESTLYASVRALIEAARGTIARGVDLVQVHTNFGIGRHVVAFEQRGDERAEYGMQVLKQLAERLTAEFGNGFSLSNLKLMRQFYVQYAQRIGQTTSGFSDGQTPRAISQTLSDLLASDNGKRPFTLSWSHYVFLLGIKNADERSFYEIESTQQNWTLRELRRQFQSGWTPILNCSEYWYQLPERTILLPMI